MDNTKSRNQIDMLHGPLLMKIIVFTLPLAASSILQQLFNSVDVAVVGLCQQPSFGGSGKQHTSHQFAH